MPQITAYLRVEDIELWKAIPSKSQFLHDALNSRSARDSQGSARVDAPLAENTTVKRDPEGTMVTRGLCKQHNVPKSVCEMMKHD